MPSASNVFYHVAEAGYVAEARIAGSLSTQMRSDLRLWGLVCAGGFPPKGSWQHKGKHTHVEWLVHHGDTARLSQLLPYIPRNSSSAQGDARSFSLFKALTQIPPREDMAAMLLSDGASLRDVFYDTVNCDSILVAPILSSVLFNTLV